MSFAARAFGLPSSLAAIAFSRVRSVRDVSLANERASFRLNFDRFVPEPTAFFHHLSTSSHSSRLSMARTLAEIVSKSVEANDAWAMSERASTPWRRPTGKRPKTATRPPPTTTSESMTSMSEKPERRIVRNVPIFTTS